MAGALLDMYLFLKLLLPSLLSSLFDVCAFALLLLFTVAVEVHQPTT